MKYGTTENKYVYLTARMVLGAEGDVVISTRSASGGASIIVFGIAISLWALPLKELGILRRRAVVGVVSRAAVLRSIESSATTVAPIDHFQFCRAARSYVAATLNCWAATVRGSYGEREIKSINEIDVIRVAIVGPIQSIFSQRCRRSSSGLTVEQATAVSSVAAAFTKGIERVARSSPKFACACSCGHVNTP